MKVALRTGILKTKIPLMSSFLDIYDYQYALIDLKTQEAWRKVWSYWNEKYQDECVEGPCLIDYYIFNYIGKELCTDKIKTYKCRCKHVQSGKRKKQCEKCGESEYLEIIDRKPLCLEKKCPFEDVCQPNKDDFIKLNYPKAISIIGIRGMGWDSAYTRKDEGGGGLRT